MLSSINESSAVLRRSIQSPQVWCFMWEHKWRPSSAWFYHRRKIVHKHSGYLSSKWKVVWHLHELKEVNLVAWSTCLHRLVILYCWQYKQLMNKVKARLGLTPSILSGWWTRHKAFDCWLKIQYLLVIHIGNLLCVNSGLFWNEILEMVRAYLFTDLKVENS